MTLRDRFRVALMAFRGKDYFDGYDRGYGQGWEGCLDAYGMTGREPEEGCRPSPQDFGAPPRTP